MKCIRQQCLRVLLVGMLAVITMLAHHQEGFASAGVRTPLQYVLAASGLPNEGIWKSTPILVDINSDGWLDLIVLPRLGRGARVWLGDGRGAWMDSSLGLQMDVSCGGGIVTGDVNHDGHLDLVAADHCAGVFVYCGDSQGNWREVARGLNPSFPDKVSLDENDENPWLGAEDVALGDINEDGWPDLVTVASNQGGFTVYLGDGSGKTWQEITNADGLPSGRDPEAGDKMQGGFGNRVLLTDIDGDSHLDVIASYYTGPKVWKGDGKGHWRGASQGLSKPIIGGAIRSLALGDINEDGLTDLVVANVKDGPEVYVQNRDGSWQLRPSAAFTRLQHGVESVALGDLNKDGHVDLVAGGRLGQHKYSGISIFWGNGDASWIAIEQTQLPTEGIPWVWGVTLGDINRDGYLDIALSSGLKSRAGVDKKNNSSRAPSTMPANIKEESFNTMPQPELPRVQVWLHSKIAASQ